MKKAFISIVLILIVSVFQSCNFLTAASTKNLSFKEAQGNLTYTLKPTTQKADHKSWDSLLKKYVDEDGFVDYEGFKNNQEQLIDYLNYLSKNIPDESWTIQEQLAFYINLYNAATVNLILNNYPTESIKDISKPWGKLIIKLGEESFSLGDIEHNILRKMNEPRIHFAINCASYSCPNLLNEAFTASKIEEQLERVSYSFINGNKNDISEENPNLSKIFKWYKKDFNLDGDNLISFINKYSSIKINADADIDYKDYNWNLNEK